MSFYHRLGQIPHKRHTQFRQPDGSLYREELVSSQGFHGIYSILYHKNQPTQVAGLGEPVRYGYKIAHDYPLQQTHLKTSGIGNTGGDYLKARQWLFANADVAMALCSPTVREMDYFYKNGEADEVLYVHDGSGELVSQFGRLPFRQGDYVVIPRTTIYQMRFDEGRCGYWSLNRWAPLKP
jgi:homogentisate 1,2-dioxygenase